MRIGHVLAQSPQRPSLSFGVWVLPASWQELTGIQAKSEVMLPKRAWGNPARAEIQNCSKYFFFPHTS